MQHISNRRKNQQRDRIQNKNRSEQNRHFLFIGLKNRTDRRDGAATANRRATRDQKRSMAPNAQEFAERQARDKREGNSQRRVKKTRAAGFQDFVEIHAKAERHDGTLQKDAGNSPAFVEVRMRKTESEEQTQSKRDWRRDKFAEGKRKTKSKNNLRESGHRRKKE